MLVHHWLSRNMHIMDDVCILTATGTAAVIRRAKRRKFKRGHNMGAGRHVRHTSMPLTTTNASPRTSFSGGFFHSGSGSSGTSSNPLGDGRRRTSERIGTGSSPGAWISGEHALTQGAPCHIPFPHGSPFENMRLVPCQSCKKLPEVLLATIECPPLLLCHGWKVVQARACKMSSSQTKIQKGKLWH